MTEETYCLRFLFEYGSFCLWSENEKAETSFGSPISPEKLPLSPPTVHRVNEMCEWFDRSLNWDYPPNPGPWRQVECDRFHHAAQHMFETLKRELGTVFELR